MKKQIIGIGIALVAGMPWIQVQAQDESPTREVGRPDVPEQRIQLNELRKSLNETRREALSVLSEDATIEERMAILEEWQAENIDDIELARSLRSELRENRPDRPRPPEINERREKFRDRTAQLREARKDLRESLRNPDLTEEARKQLIADFRDAYGDLIQEIKDLRRKQRRGDGDLGGERRPGE